MHPPSIYDLVTAGPRVEIQAVLFGALITLLIAWRVNASLGPDAAVPDARLSVRNVMEILFEGIANLAHDIIGHDGRKFLPLACTLGLFILISNLLGLVPGVGGATSYLETNLAWAMIAVVVSEGAGVVHHGPVKYVHQFLPGPWWMWPLMFPIEVFSHFVRIVSLTIRLTANMFADHTLLAIFIGFGGVVAAGVAWILLGLGLLICFVQAFVFTLLTMVYIGLAVGDAH